MHYVKNNLTEAIINFIQWPAMAITLLSAWLVASQSKPKRSWGFWTFMLSDVLWMLWGWQNKAYALIFMQIGLLFLNVRGAMKNKN